MGILAARDLERSRHELGGSELLERRTTRDGTVMRSSARGLTPERTRMTRPDQRHFMAEVG